jgi:hypothetical protein
MFGLVEIKKKGFYFIVNNIIFSNLMPKITFSSTPGISFSIALKHFL